MPSPASSRVTAPAAIIIACLLTGCGQPTGPTGPMGPASQNASDLPASVTSTAPPGSTAVPTPTAPGGSKGPGASGNSPECITSGPPPSGDSACAIFHFFTWPPNAAMFGAFYNPANNATPGDASLPYLEKAKIYTETAEYRDIRRMITSLRPAG